jgi:hypothetical protein
MGSLRLRCLPPFACCLIPPETKKRSRFGLTARLANKSVARWAFPTSCRCLGVPYAVASRKLRGDDATASGLNAGQLFTIVFVTGQRSPRLRARSRKSPQSHESRLSARCAAIIAPVRAECRIAEYIWYPYQKELPDPNGRIRVVPDANPCCRTLVESTRRPSGLKTIGSTIVAGVLRAWRSDRLARYRCARARTVPILRAGRGDCGAHPGLEFCDINAALMVPASGYLSVDPRRVSRDPPESRRCSPPPRGFSGCSGRDRRRLWRTCGEPSVGTPGQSHWWLTSGVATQYPASNTRRVWPAGERFWRTQGLPWMARARTSSPAAGQLSNCTGPQQPIAGLWSFRVF